ncbi:MAG: mevalonate kinase [Candidatus Lokiarchaeota archaeon]|nr:mevalonate kinase [Candidatus Lokiarchaeota archaeon]
MIIASAPGKCILLGEHAVVYGYPAVAVALNIRSYCSIHRISEKYIHFNLPDQSFDIICENLEQLLKSIPQKYLQFPQVLVSLSKRFNFKVSNISIQIQSNLWRGAGLGSSASTSIAFLFAIFHLYRVDKKFIPEFAFMMEKYVHGTPSGIDNSVCYWGGTLVFQEKIREKFTIPKFPMLITHSGTTHNTGNIVREIKNSSSSMKKSFSEIGQIVQEGLNVLKLADLVRLGELFNKNHDILSTMGVSTEDIEIIRTIALTNGAYGSKVTGAGGGGCVISLGELNNLKKIKSILHLRGYISKISYVDYNGGRIESE